MATDQENADAIAAALANAAVSPQRVRGDGIEVQQHSISDLIAADRYLTAKTARRGRGLRFAKLIPDGTVR